MPFRFLIVMRKRLNSFFYDERVFTVVLLVPGTGRPCWLRFTAADATVEEVRRRRARLPAVNTHTRSCSPPRESWFVFHVDFPDQDESCSGDLCLRLRKASRFLATQPGPDRHTARRARSLGNIGRACCKTKVRKLVSPYRLTSTMRWTLRRSGRRRRSKAGALQPRRLESSTGSPDATRGIAPARCRDRQRTGLCARWPL